MEIPFSSSGAMSRAHYALVRKIESATPQAADQILLAEVHSIRNQLTRSTLTLKQCKECLVLLLYCSMAVNPGVHVDLEFALPHAINLAEAGKTVQDKRTGYLFCAEVMPPEHELQLMLVNSIRKDLEGHSVPRICLALDTLIQTPSKDVIPAIQTRLHDLLSHDSPPVKRRALLAFHKLSEQDPDILKHVLDPVRKRLNDSQVVVVCAALTVTDALLKARHIHADEYHTAVSKLLDTVWAQPPEASDSKLLLRLLRVLTELTPSSHDLKVIAQLVHYYASYNSTSAYAILSQCFRALAAASAESLIQIQSSNRPSLIQDIRHLLTSDDPNALYTFICCLASLDPRLWAGTTSEIPAVLEEREVERVMRLLDSEDEIIRKQTLRTLWRVDQSIIESYYTRALQRDIPSSSPHDTEDHLPRTFEILDVICGEDGETYAHQLKNILKSAEGEGQLNKRTVLQPAVEALLVRVHAADSSWRSGCIGVLFTSIVEKNEEVGPTLMVIITALLCEYLELSPISPIDLMRGLAGRLPLYSASVQDACLITMLRLSVACDEIHGDVNDAVIELHARSGRYIRKRCDQFIALSKSEGTLKHIISGARSSSLPDLVFALEQYEANERKAPSRSPSLLPSSPPSKSLTPEPSSSRASPVPSKLRYAAYEAPRPTSRLRRMSNSSSRHSDDGSSHGWQPYQDSMTMTVTAGDLTLAAQTSDLRSIPSSSPSRAALSPLPIVQILDEEPPDNTTADLIALDSPFISEPAAPSIANKMSSIMEQDFETTWNALELGAARGWCEVSMDTVLRRLQGLQHRLRVTDRDRPPFEGDLKIVLGPESTSPSSKAGLAAIRLKESEDDSCLWWLRCEDEQLREVVKATLK